MQFESSALLEIGEYDSPEDESNICLKEIAHLNCDFPYGVYFRDYMLSNKPCIIKLQSTLNIWPCKQWTIEGKPNYSFLEAEYGTATVPVADCRDKYYNSQKKSDMEFKEYLNYWKDCSANPNDSSKPCLYLKDWHFTKYFPEENVYRVPCYFASDWLNEYLTQKDNYDDDYRFVYMGPKGSWTPFHSDVFTSFSWSVNICGKKRWLLFPPGEENNLRDKCGNLAYDVTSNEMDEVTFPNCKKVSLFYDIIQEEGEAIFVPSGWHHQVWNLEDTISINHNWVNGCNIYKVWRSLHASLSAVKKEVEDCKDMENWEEHCQLMLKATHGMNYQDFYNFLQFIVKRRVDFFQRGTNFVVFGDWTFGKNHILFDLIQINRVLQEFLQEAEVACVLLDGECRRLIDCIHSVQNNKVVK